MAQKYDIFISYRHNAFESANLFATRLKALGYRVFFDIETMSPGMFDEQLLDVIGQCNDFVLILSPNSLERCTEEKDWFRREIMCAMEHKKNIIPIMLSGFVWPQEMPHGMEELCNYQALAPAYYDLQVQRLTRYLKSKAHFQTRKRWLMDTAIIVAILAILMIIVHLTFMPVAQNVADNLTMQTQCMNDLAGVSKSLQTEWERYVQGYMTSKSKADKAEWKEMMQGTINIEEKHRDALLKTLKASPVQVCSIFLPLFWMRGISPADLLICNTYTESLFDDLQSQIDYYNSILEADNYSQLNMHMAKINSNIIVVYTATYYYCYLQMMTHLPKSTHRVFNLVSQNWHNLPKAELGLSDEEYERQQNILANEAEKEMKQLEKVLARSESELEEQEKRLRQMEESVGKMDKRIDTVNVVNKTIMRQLQ